MTWVELVRKYFPQADDKHCDFILWEKTCYPMGYASQIEEQIEIYAKKVKKERDASDS